MNIPDKIPRQMVFWVYLFYTECHEIAVICTTKNIVPRKRSFVKQLGKVFIKSNNVITVRLNPCLRRPIISDSLVLFGMTLSIWL